MDDAAALEEMTDGGDYPLYFGVVSCGFFALHLISRANGLDPDLGRQYRIGEMMLRGSAHLLGLLVWRAQRRWEELAEMMTEAESEVQELKLRRTEDAKANEKVVCIFAAHEQSWIAERKKLRFQIHALLNELRAVKAEHEEAVSDLSRTVEGEENEVRIKDEAFEEEAKKRKELEEKLQAAERAAEELRVKARKDAQDHSSELWKHKTAFVELVSNQRQLEAEHGRALQQLEASRQEIDEILEQKEAAASMVDKLSGEVVRRRKDAEQKDKILSAMMRKSKVDTAEKQMLLKEVKICKARKKQAELDLESWMNMWESRQKKRSSGSSSSAEAGSSEERRPELQLRSSEYHRKIPLHEHLEAEIRGDHKPPSSMGEDTITTIHCLDQYSCDDSDELVTNDIKNLRDWVRVETDKCAIVLEQRHCAEVEAFTEQMRLKDEKLEALQWQLLSMELESKQLQSHMEGLDGNLTQLRDEILRLEALLLDREKELKVLTEQFNFQNRQCQKTNSKKTTSWVFDPQALWSEVKITKKKTRGKEQETRAVIVTNHPKPENKIKEDEDQNEDTSLLQLESQNFKEPTQRESKFADSTTTSSTNVAPPTDHLKDYPVIYVNKLSVEVPEIVELSSWDQQESTPTTIHIPEEVIEEEKEVSMDAVHVRKLNKSHRKIELADKSVPVEKSFTIKDTSWKMDIHALGVSYKIKRMKQQLLVFETLAGAQAMKHLMVKDDVPEGSKERKVFKNNHQINGFPLVISLLNKQVKRYQSLEEKTDDLCRRMHESYRTGISRDAHNDRTKEQTEMLESFLEETFQLQRFMVATGQKLVEVQSRITCSFAISDGFDESAGFNMRQFADVVRSLFREIQRGLEVRIARIIGDLEGTLASDGILHR